MAKPVKITADTTADLTPALCEKYHISLLPLYVTMDDTSYSDGVDIQPQALFDYFKRTGKIARSSARNTTDYHEDFKKWTDRGYAVVHFNLSSGMSATHQNACAAAAELPDVYVVDSLTLSTGTALLAVAAAEMAQQGMAAPEIFAQTTAMIPRLDVSFIIDTLDYLHAGGRCSTVARLGANFLSLKPSIVVTPEGKMVVGKKYRGKTSDCRSAYVADQFTDLETIDLNRIFVTHSKIPRDAAAAVVEQVRAIAPFKEVLETDAGCVISAHCGPGTIGVLFLHKDAR